MRKRKLAYWIKNFILIHIAGFLIIIPLFQALIHHPLDIPAEGQLIDVPPGATVKVIAEDLYQKGLLRHPQVMVLYTRLTFQDKQIRAGEYLIPAHTNITSLITLLRSGLIFMREIRFIEGTTAKQMIQIIQDNPYLKHTINFHDPNWFRAFSQRYDNPEGLLMPDTYLFAKWDTDTQIVQRAYTLMHKTLTQAWEHRSLDLPYTDPYQALIAASIIEKETAIPAERPIISGVIVRRLAKNMRLQMDPTVIYALGDRYTGTLSKADLMYKSPYNTYVTAGLPPTPICMPSRASVTAAMNPDTGTTLYFVARGDGSHHFSDTLQGHQSAVIEFQPAKPAPPLKKEPTWSQKPPVVNSSP